MDGNIPKDADDAAKGRPSATVAPTTDAAPKIKLDVEYFKCSTAATGALLAAAGFASALSLLFPWWEWIGREVDDFWGVPKDVVAHIPPLTACSTDWGAGAPSADACATLGGIVTFLFAGVAASGTGAILCLVMVLRRHWIFGLLSVSVVALGGAVVLMSALYMAYSMDLSGLEGLGYYLAFFALICNALASTLAIWGANKATPSAEEQRYVAPPPPPSRLLRFRDSLVADEVLADELAQRQCTRVNSGTSRDLSAVEEEGEEEAKKEYPILQKVIDWGTSPESRAPIPVSLLEAAFEEVDEDATGTITKEEFASALQACGFNPSLAAMDRIMLEIDRDNSGEIDIHEFVRFFKMTEELVAFAGLSENRKTLQGACCSMCFCMNLIAWAVIGVLQTPGSEMASMWQGLTAALVVLFIYNVGLPMVRLTLGPSIAAWWEIVNFHIQRIKNRRRAQAAKRETERQEALELERRAAAWEAGIADSQGSSPKSPRSPHSPGVTQSSWTSPGPREAGQGAEVAALTDVSGSEHSPKALMPPGSPLSRCSPWGTSTWSQEEEEEGGDTPGVYLVLHEGTSVRTGVSIHSPVKRLLKRGAQVRIAEVFHYKRQGRLRGRLENLGTGAGGGWITIKDPADDYRWAQRTGPLQRNPAWGRGGSLRRTRRPSELGSPSGSISRGHTSVLSPGASSRGTFRSTRSSGRPSQGAGRRSKVSDAESLGAPPYEPDAYDEAWARAEAWAPETTFIGTSQVRDVRLYLGQREELPEHRFVPGGAAFSRGEWRAGLNAS